MKLFAKKEKLSAPVCKICNMEFTQEEGCSDTWQKRIQDQLDGKIL